MSLDLEAKLRTFFSSAPQTVHQIETLEISHSAITTWHLWREPYAGTTTVGGVPRTMTPANIEIKPAGSPGHLDQVFSIRIGLVDAMDTFRDQIDLIPIDTLEKVKIIYRVFLSDDLTDVQATAALQVESVSWVKGAANISAVSPRLNALTTGEIYDMRSVPTLRGFV